MQNDDTTDFGFEKIEAGEKQRRVGEVFTSVAQNYDLMNDLMSFGIHRLWKHFTLEMCGLRPGHRVLDLAGGTGDLALGEARRVGEGGQVVLADINAEMLSRGRDRCIDEGLLGRVAAVQCCITIAFGLRNVTDKGKALASMQRVLKPGGRLCVLEFSKPIYEPLEKLYDLYSFQLLPRMGAWVTGDGGSYRYLAESIRMHPDQQALRQMILDEGGFDEVEIHNLSGGIVALHRAFKY